MMPPFELGLNYWPRRHAMYMWQELDLLEVRDEFAHIAALGFDVVRLFVLTQDFLPAPETVATDKLARLVDVVRVAEDAGLRVVPTLIVINMSGRMWWPRWMLDRAGRPVDLFADPVVLRSQIMLVGACARALAGHAGLRAIDLANEIDGAQVPASRAAARTWTAVLADTVRQAAGDVPIQIGAHLPSLAGANNMRVDDLAEAADEDVMHAYPLYSDAARSFLDPELVPFSCALTSALAGAGRPTLMQEFGLCTAPRGSAGYTMTDDFLGLPLLQYLASEEEAARYYGDVLERLVTTGAAGAYPWCYADYDARLFDRPPLDTAIRERTFGLVRSDGSEKPVVRVVQQFKQRLNQKQIVPGPRPEVLDVTADAYYAAPATHFNRLYRSWVAALDERPPMVQ